IDGDLATRWSAAGDGQWIEYDLGQVQSVASAAIALHRGDARRAYFDVAISADGADFNTVLAGGESSGSTADPEPNDFAEAAARFVRIVGRGNSSDESGEWNSIAEVQLRAEAGCPAVPPPPPPAPASDSIVFLSDFETGAIQPPGGDHDSWKKQIAKGAESYAMKVVGSGQSGAPEARDGQRVCRFELRPGDVFAGDDRVELASAPGLIPKGVERWVGLSRYLTGTFTSSDDLILF